jgi:dTDP-4-dehydrorhamnose reductase
VDVSDRQGVTDAINAFSPEVVIHAAAWTDVDGCARDPERAYLVNALGTQNVALAAAQAGADLVYISTNEVFDGRNDEPYHETDPVQPINPYGSSKAAGEAFAREAIDRCYVARTAWLYAPGGHNFPHRILELAAERGALRVVSDEVGNPTYAPDLAEAVSALLGTGAYGTYHLANAGYCSRFDFAREVLRLAGQGDVELTPISLADYQRDSSPPPFAPLANTAAAALGITLRPWQEALAEFVQTGL